MELPDWLRGIVLLGKDDDEYRVVGVDADGYLGAILKAAAAVTIADHVTVEQDDSVRQVQGAEGENLRTIAVDASGRIIMIPYGTTAVTQEDSAREMQGAEGETLRTIAVDAQGRIIMVPYGTVTVDGAVTTSGTATVTQEDSAREMQGAEGANLRTVAVDANGQIIMVPRGATGNYLAVDAQGYMGAILKATADVAVTGTAAVTQEDSVREMQGAEGENLRTIAVDASGRIIMIPYGTTAVTQEDSAREMQGAEGETLRTIAVDAQGRIIMVPYGTVTVDGAVTTSGTATVTQEDSAREMQGAEGANLRTVAVDANGQIIMVPRGATGNYLAVDAQGYMGAILKATADVAVTGTAAVTQEDSVRQVQGAEGANLRTIAVDANGQIIMVPRGASGNYLGVDDAGYMTTVMKGTYGALLKTLATDDDGNLIALLTDAGDQWGKKVNVGIGELAARLGSPISWDRRGQVVRMQTFADGMGGAYGVSSGTQSSVGLDPSLFLTGGYSCKLKTGIDAFRRATVGIYGDYAPADTVGFEFVFSMASQPDDIYLLADVWDGSHHHQVYARIHHASHTVQIQNSTPAYEDAYNFTLPALPHLFGSVKFVVNLSTRKWVRLLVRGHEEDISAVSLYSTGDAMHPYFSYQIQAEESAAVSHVIYLDRMIITTNEP